MTGRVSMRHVCCKCFHVTIKYRCPECEHDYCISCREPEKRQPKKRATS